MPVLSLMFQQEQTSVLAALVDLVRTECNFRACMTRVINACIMHSMDAVEIKENAQTLKPQFHEILVKHYLNFFQNAIESSYACGFVPFYVRKVDGVSLPFVLEIGTFSWVSVVVDLSKAGPKRRRLDGTLQYEVTPISGVTLPENIQIFPYVTPTSRGLKIRDYSPLRNIVELYMITQALNRQTLQNSQWNNHKHLVMTESIDLKDQTTSGIQLLDQMRRYTYAGDTGGVKESTLMYSNKSKQQLRSVNDAKFHWIHDQFDLNDHAQTHVLPPNTQVQELSPINMNSEIEYFNTMLQNNIYAFFDNVSVQDISSSRSSTSTDQISRQQHMSILNTCRFMENLGTFAYAQSFGVDEKKVKFKIRAQSRLEVTNVSDFKPLVESNILSGLDKNRIRKMIGM